MYTMYSLLTIDYLLDMQKIYYVFCDTTSSSKIILDEIPIEEKYP